jgi:hypothetical protein
MQELLVILGAEASILVFVAAMTVYAKRMDVLSGRTFEQSIDAARGRVHSPPPRRARDLLPLIGTWLDVAATDRSNLVQRPDLTKTPRSPRQSRSRTLS